MDDDHPQDLFLVQLPAPADGLGSPQSLEHHGGANHVEDQRNEEAHRLDEDDHFGQVALPLFRREVLEARRRVVAHGSTVQHEARRETSREHQNPNGGANDFGVAFGPKPPGAEGVDDGEEAVRADAGEEQDAPVHVGVKERDRELADQATERPVLLDEIKDPQGQRENEQQVGHHQVDHVRGGLVPQFQGTGKNVHGCHVGDESHHEDDAEHYAIEGIFKSVVLRAMSDVAQLQRAGLGQNVHRRSCVIHLAVKQRGAGWAKVKQ